MVIVGGPQGHLFLRLGDGPVLSDLAETGKEHSERCSTTRTLCSLWGLGALRLEAEPIPTALQGAGFSTRLSQEQT